MSSRKALAIIAGAGPGTGAAIARAFAKQGYSVALLARTASSINSLAEEIKSSGGSAHAFPTDLHSPAQLSQTFSSIGSTFPDTPLKVAVFNLNTKWTVKPFLELKQEEYQDIIGGHLGAAFSFSQEFLKRVVPEEGAYDGNVNGTLIFTGATAATRGSSKFAALASASFGLRALSQSLAREFQPKGIHVAHAIIDGVIDTDRAKSMMGNSASAATGERLDPAGIAQSYVWLSEQPPTAWTHELDLRPAREKW